MFSKVSVGLVNLTPLFTFIKLHSDTLDKSSSNEVHSRQALIKSLYLRAGKFASPSWVRMWESVEDMGIRCTSGILSRKLGTLISNAKARSM